MPQRRRWVSRLIRRLKRSGEPEEELDRMAVKAESAEDVFGLGVTSDELQEAVQAMRDDLRELSREIRNHLNRYQKYLHHSDQTTGIDATDFRLDAQAELEDAQDKHEEYNSLAAKYQVLRRALKKWERIQRRERRQRKYEVDMGEIDVDQARREIERLEEEGQIEHQNADRLRRQLDMLGDTAEPDLEDVNKDLEELEKERLSSQRDDEWDLDSVGAPREGTETELEDDPTEDPITMEDLEEL